MPAPLRAGYRACHYWAIYCYCNSVRLSETEMGFFEMTTLSKFFYRLADTQAKFPQNQTRSPKFGKKSSSAEVRCKGAFTQSTVPDDAVRYRPISAVPSAAVRCVNAPSRSTNKSLLLLLVMPCYQQRSVKLCRPLHVRGLTRVS